jgi:hypothetical protein
MKRELRRMAQWQHSHWVQAVVTPHESSRFEGSHLVDAISRGKLPGLWCEAFHVLRQVQKARG